MCPLFPFDTNTTVDDLTANIVSQLWDETPDESRRDQEEGVCEQSGELEQALYVADPPSGEKFTHMLDFLIEGSEQNEHEQVC